VLGAAPNAVDEPEKIFEAVLSCTWVSSPMVISQVIKCVAVLFFISVLAALSRTVF
jgi:hypothetical protein